MTHFIIPEDKDENWKDSEVMRRFADILLESQESLNAVEYDIKLITEEDDSNLFTEHSDLENNSNPTSLEKPPSSAKKMPMKVEVDEDGDMEVLFDPEDPEFLLHVDKVVAQLENQIDTLKKIAVDSQKYGNEIATYKIEEATFKLEDMLIKYKQGE